VRSDIIQAYYKFDMYERTMSRYLNLAYSLIKQSVRPGQLTNEAEEIKTAIVGQIEDPSRREEGMLAFTPAVVREIDEEVKRLRDG